MPRCGWQALDTPCGWYEVIRGPRPRSVQWPLAKPVRSATGPQTSNAGGSGEVPRAHHEGHHSSPPFHGWVPTRGARPLRRSPEVRGSVAFEKGRFSREGRFEGILRAGGRAGLSQACGCPHQVLRELPPEMHETTRGGQGIRQEMRGGGYQDPSEVGQIEDGSRSATYRAKSAPRRSGIGSGSPPETSVRVAAEATASQHPIQGSEEAYVNLKKRAAKRRVCPDRPPSHEQDLEAWMSDKHLELRDAPEFGDTTYALELSKLLSEGAALMQRIREQCCPPLPVSQTWSPCEKVFVMRLPRSAGG